MWKNWFGRADDEPGAPPREGEEAAAESRPMDRRKIIAAVLAGVALLLLVLLLCLVLLLTTKESKNPSNSPGGQPLHKRHIVRKGELADYADYAGVRTTISLNDCIDEPPSPTGMIRTWDGIGRILGTTIGYRCDKDPDDEQVMMVVCVEYQWKILYQKTNSCVDLLHSRRCLGDPLPSRAAAPFDWDYQRREVGTRVAYKCSPAEDSPVMRVLVCTRDYEWRILSDTAEKCMCGKPMYFAPPLIYDWDGKTVKPGTTVKYTCGTELGSSHYQTIACQNNATWLVVKTGVCYFLVDRPLNFTDAVTYCHEMGAEMMVVNDQAEQDGLITLLKEEKSFDSTCNHKAFLGMREDVSRQWKTEDNIYVSGHSEIFFIVDEGREHCAVIQRPGNYKLSNVLCKGMQYCQLCEIAGNLSNPLCPQEKGVCYAPKNTLGDYRVSVKTCEALGGRLGQISSMVMLDLVREVLNKGSPLTSRCEAYYVGLRSDERFYKTYKDENVQYSSFVDDTRRSLNRHCVVIHELQRFMWADEHCSLPSCFMCRMAGKNLGSFLPSNVKMVPHVTVRTSEGDEKAVLAQRKYRYEMLANASVACDPGWVTDGFHCYLFNETLVTNSEARIVCRDYYGSLASLVSPYERNFIMGYLTSKWNNTGPSVWHVESAGGLPSVTDDDDDIGFYPGEEKGSESQCVSVHLSPTIGWTTSDCNQAAAFICHD